MSHAVLIGERCHYCSKFRGHADMLAFGDGGQIKMCHQCYEKHRAALAALQKGEPPEACQECGGDFLQEVLPGDGNSRMWIHAKDGIYQMLCSKCSDAYEQKRRDLYGSTAYGQLKQI